MPARLLTDEEEHMIGEIYRYSGKSARQIAFSYKLEPGTVTYLLRKRIGIYPTKHRRINLYRANSKAFDILDEDSAYWLGFLYADGYTSSKGSVVLTLSSIDKEHLCKFLDFLDSNYPIHVHHIEPIDSVGVYIRDHYMVKRLRNLGVVFHRTVLPQLKSQLPPSLYSHFVRGFFDGNGHRRKPGRFGIGFSGRFDILEWIREILAEKAGANPNTKIMKFQKANAYNLEFGGRIQTAKIYEWMYKDATICLERKKVVPEIYFRPGWNKTTIPGKVTSRYKGIYLSKSKNLWEAQICVNGKRIYLGRYKTEIEAALAYDKATRELRGKDAFLNFP